MITIFTRGGAATSICIIPNLHMTYQERYLLIHCCSTLLPPNGQGIKCAEKIKPSEKSVTNNGDIKPHTGQNATMVEMYDKTPQVVEIGIIFGDAKCQGKFSFITTGNQKER